MGKPAVQRQKEYLARLKAKNNDDYLKKERKRKRSMLQKLKNEQDNYKMFLQKDRLRKKLAYEAKTKRYEKLFYTVDEL